MATRPTPIRWAVLVCGALLAAPTAALAFTSDDGSGRFNVPKFDLDEQMKNFRTPGLDTSTPGKGEYDTPFGKLQFGVQGGGSPWETAPMRNRMQFERMVAPPNLRDRY